MCTDVGTSLVKFYIYHIISAAVFVLNQLWLGYLWLVLNGIIYNETFNVSIKWSNNWKGWLYVLIVNIFVDLFRQISLDCMFLDSQSIIDYSMLLGIHFRAPYHLKTDSSTQGSSERCGIPGMCPTSSTLLVPVWHSSQLLILRQNQGSCAKRCRIRKSDCCLILISDSLKWTNELRVEKSSFFWFWEVILCYDPKNLS
jgi:hypothetical protein